MSIRNNGVEAIFSGFLIAVLFLAVVVIVEWVLLKITPDLFWGAFAKLESQESEAMRH